MMNAIDIQTVVDAWVAYTILGEPPDFTALRPAYVRHHLQRCLGVLELIPNPPQHGRLLELGACFYLMTFLLKRFCNYDLELVQYWSMPNGAYESVLIDQRTGRQMVLPFQQFNAEIDIFPYPDAWFDVILTCEIIEHLLCNPVHMLTECRRVLKPGGLILLTTPNVLRLSNVLGLLRGQNIYDKYWRQSPYGRHPREYTLQEIQRLFTEAGFRVISLHTRDVTSPQNGVWSRSLARLFVGVSDLADRVRGHRETRTYGWRGEQIFLTAERTQTEIHKPPDFLFFDPHTLVNPPMDAVCRHRRTLED